jgi:hypothetical protein
LSAWGWAEQRRERDDEAADAMAEPAAYECGSVHARAHLLADDREAADELWPDVRVGQ